MNRRSFFKAIAGAVAAAVVAPFSNKFPQDIVIPNITTEAQILSKWYKLDGELRHNFTEIRSGNGELLWSANPADFLVDGEYINIFGIWENAKERSD